MDSHNDSTHLMLMYQLEPNQVLDRCSAVLLAELRQSTLLSVAFGSIQSGGTFILMKSARDCESNIRDLLNERFPRQNLDLTFGNRGYYAQGRESLLPIGLPFSISISTVEYSWLRKESFTSVCQHFGTVMYCAAGHLHAAIHKGHYMLTAVAADAGIHASKLRGMGIRPKDMWNGKLTHRLLLDS